jgi:hypothetical protein
MMRLLTDADVSADRVYGAVIKRNRGLIRALGWSQASMVDQYNIVVSLGAKDDRAAAIDPTGREGPTSRRIW